MSEPLPRHIVQVDSRTIRIGDRTVLTTFPIDHLTMIDGRLLLAVENYGEEDWLYQSFTLEPEGVVLGTRRLFGGVVRRGTRLTLPRNDNRGLILPSCTEVRLPGSVFSVAETSEGFVVVVDADDVPIDNAFFVTHEGTVRWQVRYNSYAGPRTAGGYVGVTRRNGRTYLSLAPFGYFLVDEGDGSIIEQVHVLP